MSKDQDRATPTGVRNEDTRNATEVLADHENPMSERERMMNAMEARRDAELSEGADIDAPVDETARNTDQQLAAQLAADSPTVLADGFDRYRVKTKIDGVDGEVSLDEIVRQYQKGGAADRRLADATRLLEEARAVKATVRPEPEPIPVDPDAPSPKKKFIAALFQGDEDAASQAFDEAVGAGRQQPTLDANDLARTLTPAIKQQLVVESALEQFQKDYADVMRDPYLAAKADGLLNAAVSEGQSFADALKQAGDGTRDWVRSLTGAAPAGANPTTARNERLERKAGIDSIPATSAKAVTAQETEPNHSDIIAEMRASRGQNG